MGLRGGAVNFCLQKSVPIGRIGIFRITFCPEVVHNYSSSLDRNSADSVFTDLVIAPQTLERVTPRKFLESS